MESVWGQILAHREALGRAGLAAKRAGQARAVLWREIEEEVRGRLAAKGALQGLLERLESDISQGLISAPQAARRVVDALAKPGS
jgi:LAO/AO transport system kinase